MFITMQHFDRRVDSSLLGHQHLPMGYARRIFFDLLRMPRGHSRRRHPGAVLRVPWSILRGTADRQRYWTFLHGRTRVGAQYPCAPAGASLREQHQSYPTSRDAGFNAF
jgi:hypothetical protein